MRRSFYIFAVLTLLLAGCGEETPRDFHGRLYFASGNYIGEFDLATGSSIAVANRGAVTVEHVSPFVDEGLLLVEVATVEGREVSRISWLEPESGRASTLYSGVAARYLPRHRAIAWDDGTRLHVSSRVRDAAISAEVMTHNLNQLRVIIDAGDDTVLFEVGTPEQRQILAYNVVTRELEARDQLTAACRLDGAIWLDGRAQLACPARAGDSVGSAYLLVGPDGTVRGQLALPEGRQFVALAYAADQQTLFFAERWASLLGGAERYAVWAYDLVDGRSFRLVRNQYLGTSAVYTES